MAEKKQKTDQQLYLWIGIGVMGGLIGAALILLLTRPPRGIAIELQPAPSPAPILVHVSGGVTNPGTYQLAYGSRAQDALDAAGGALAEANLDALNLARRLSDGDQVHVPLAGDNSSVQFPLNINIASLDELAELPGIGPTIAQAIIDYRQSHGNFQDPAEIQNVAGIGPATYQNIQDLITTGQ